MINILYFLIILTIWQVFDEFSEKTLLRFSSLTVLIPLEQIGKVFRQLRESRNISLRQATGGQFSPSMLSRFETGQSELSVEKFLFALENISASVEEILFLARGFQYDTDSELRKEIIDVLDPKNIAPLEALYRR